MKRVGMKMNTNGTANDSITLIANIVHQYSERRERPLNCIGLLIDSPRASVNSSDGMNLFCCIRCVVSMLCALSGCVCQFIPMSDWSGSLPMSGKSMNIILTLL